MHYEKIELEHRDHVAIIRLNDPAKLNAVGHRMIEELNDALDRAVQSSRAIVLTGNGRAFCSGAALDGIPTGQEANLASRDFGAILESHINPMMSKLRNLPVPWISGVRGAAAGVGASFGLAADMVVAAESAYFLQAFARIGLVPDGGACHLLVRTLGRARTMELALLGDRLPAAKALEWGLINRLVPDADLDAEVLALASRLANGPSVTLGLARRLVWSAVDDVWEQSLRNECESQRLAGRTWDAEEGIAAFQQKRPAEFKGK